jgi:hypothetical protein
MLYKQTFTVEGCFNFPLDMLRYDRCTPYEQIDVDRVEASVRHDRNLRTIKLVRFITTKKDRPTIDKLRRCRRRLGIRPRGATLTERAMPMVNGVPA